MHKCNEFYISKTNANPCTVNGLKKKNKKRKKIKKNKIVLQETCELVKGKKNKRNKSLTADWTLKFFQSKYKKKFKK
jgi:hypothetical protein